MSMEISRNYSLCKTGYAEPVKEEKTVDAERVCDAEKTDAYIRGEQSGTKPSGLYRLGQDENGNPKVLFDDPKKPAEQCTANTDQTDREIQKLKEERKQLEQQIKTASGDEKRVRELEKRLAQIENELSQKDNDAYRRQHAKVQL